MSWAIVITKSALAAALGIALAAALVGAWWLWWRLPKRQVDALNYFRQMKVEPTPYGIIRWINRTIEEAGEYDQKYCRRLIDALISL